MTSTVCASISFARRRSFSVIRHTAAGSGPSRTVSRRQVRLNFRELLQRGLQVLHDFCDDIGWG